MRDVGGLPTDGGGTTRWGVLLRSDNLQSLSPADVRLLVDRLGLRTVLDLRTEGELHLEGPGPLRQEPLVAHHHLTLIPHGFDDRAGADAADVARAIPDEEPRGPEDMSGFYIGYLRDAPHSVAEALRLLADPDSGLCVAHCAAGKDRTGVIVAIALRLVGVSREAVVEDYLLTGDRIEAIRARLSASPTYAHDIAPRTVDSMRPHARNMERFLDHVDDDFGGPAGLADRIGLDETTLGQLRDRLVAGSGPA